MASLPRPLQNGLEHVSNLVYPVLGFSQILSWNGEMQLNSRTEKMPLCSPLENGGGPEIGDQIIKLSCACWDMKKCD